MNRPGQPRPGPPPGFGLPGGVGVGGSGVPRGIGPTPPGVNVYGSYGLQSQQQASSQPQRAGSLPHPSSGGFAGVGRGAGGIGGGGVGVLGGQSTNYMQSHQSAAQAQAQAQQRAGSLGFSNPSSVLHTPSSLQNAHAHQHQQQAQQQQHSNTHALAQAHQQQQNQNQSLGPPPPSQTPSAHSQGSHTSPLPPHLSSSLSPGGESTGTGGGGFDPSDFPALGASAPHAPSSIGSGAAPVSYAQAGGVSSNGLTGTTGGVNAGPTRAFTPDDFPALGGGGAPGQGQDHGPNGLEGNQGQTPGLLNLGQAHARAQTMEADKRNGPTSSQPWSASTNGTYSHLSGASPGPTGTTITGSSRDTPASSTLAATPLHGPIGIGGGPPGIAGAMGGMNSGMGPGVGGIPQTAAAQIFASAADKWGLLGLIAALRSPDPERALLAQGSDLRGMGLDLAASGATVLGARFAGPWAHSNGNANGEGGGRGEIEPDYVLPAHYSVHPPPPGPAKALLFGEETLFLVFYENPRDALQEIAAQELYTRGWRWHKTQQLWLSKDGQPQPSQKIAGGAGEAGTYVCWDAVNWGRELRDLTVMYSDLEERAPSGVFPNTVSLTYPGQGQGQGAGQQGQAQGLSGQQAQQRESMTQGPPGVGLQGPGRFGGGIAAM